MQSQIRACQFCFVTIFDLVTILFPSLVQPDVHKTFSLFVPSPPSLAFFSENFSRSIFEDGIQSKSVEFSLSQAYHGHMLCLPRTEHGLLSSRKPAFLKCVVINAGLFSHNPLISLTLLTCLLHCTSVFIITRVTRRVPLSFWWFRNSQFYAFLHNPLCTPRVLTRVWVN